MLAYRAMRRRHGIPDEDERPFNVAYAAAVRAREREDEGGSAPGVNGRRPRNALSEGQQSLRQRFNDVGKSYCGDNFILAMTDTRGFHSLLAPQVATTSHWQNASVPIVPQIAQAYAQIKQQQQKYVDIFRTLVATTQTLRSVAWSLTRLISGHATILTHLQYM
jgi:hypothetical protein